MTFEEIRGEYERQREQERKALAEYLKGHPKIKGKLEVITRGRPGKGAKNYSCNGKIPTFDLRNWKWVEVRSADGFNCVISLNMPDIAPDTGTPIALYDRIGLICLPSPKEWIYTSIDLPLNASSKEKDKEKKAAMKIEEEKKKQEIVNLVIKQYENFKKKKGV